MRMPKPPTCLCEVAGLRRSPHKRKQEKFPWGACRMFVNVGISRLLAIGTSICVIRAIILYVTCRDY